MIDLPATQEVQRDKSWELQKKPDVKLHMLNSDMEKK